MPLKSVKLNRNMCEKLFQNPPTYPSFQPFQHGQRALPAASKNSISQLRERNVDRANLRSEVRPPGEGFRAKSRKEVSPSMRRLFMDCLEQFSRPQTSSTRKAWTGASITKQKNDLLSEEVKCREQEFAHINNTPNQNK